MKREIWVGGYPSFVGGADSELLHNIDLWRSYDVDVNLVPMFGCDNTIRSFMDSMGVKTHVYRPDIFRDKITASWCNGEFLKHLPDIVEKGKPRCVLWFNCMTWLFDNEVKAHKEGWLDYHGYVSNYQKGWIKPKLDQHRPVTVFEGYRPYFNPSNKAQSIDFKYHAPDKWFALGRISRDDMHKYSSDMWRIFDRVLTPKHKKVFILGFGEHAFRRTGKAPESLDWQTWRPGEVPVREVYNLLHCIIHKTGGSRESYCRIVPEAYAYGVPMIAEDDYAFPDLIDNGVTGFRCKSSDEMSFRASELAFDEERRKKMIYAARDFLVNDIASRERCWESWQKLFAEHGTKN